MKTVPSKPSSQIHNLPPESMLCAATAHFVQTKQWSDLDYWVSRRCVRPGILNHTAKRQHLTCGAKTGAYMMGTSASYTVLNLDSKKIQVAPAVEHHRKWCPSSGVGPLWCGSSLLAPHLNAIAWNRVFVQTRDMYFRDVWCLSTAKQTGLHRKGRELSARNRKIKIQGSWWLNPAMNPYITCL